MLKFFRKHQKIFFILVTGVIVLSFTFFGTFSTIMQPQEEVPQKVTVVGKSIDGKEITDADLDAMITFMQWPIDGQGQSLFDLLFIEKGLGELALKTLFPRIQTQWQQRYLTLKTFTPYRHPVYSAISAESVWQRFAPEIAERLKGIQTGPEELSLAGALEILKLYRAERSFPAQFLKQILYFEQKQTTGIELDPSLLSGDLSIGRFQSLQQWFGPQFLELIATAILNGAAEASQREITIPRKEAEQKLFVCLAAQLKTNPSRSLSKEEVERALSYELGRLRLKPSRAVELWQSLLSFKADMEMIAASIFVDRLALDQRAKEAKEEVRVALYELPKELQFKDFRAQLKMERYLDAVAPTSGLGLPLELPNANELEKTYPELVERKIEVELSEVTLSQVAERVSLKQTWDWELEENHFASLVTEFPLLASKPKETKEERFAALSSLNTGERLKLDQAARLKMVKNHPEWIEEALRGAPARKEQWSVRLKRGSAPFHGMEAGEKLLQFLQEERKGPFTFDGDHFYTVSLLGSLSEEKQVLTFSQAFSDGTLDALLDSFLEIAYPSLSRRKELRRSDGSIRPLEEIRDHLGALLYKDRLDALKSSLGNQTLSLEECASHRLAPFLKEMAQLCLEGKALPSSQWTPLLKEESWTRGEAQFAKAEGLQEGQLSTDLEAGFFRLIARKSGSASDEEINEVQQALAKEACAESFEKNLRALF